MLHPMTDHPLTDEMCEILSRQPWLDPDVDVEGTIHDMRAAYNLGYTQGLEDAQDVITCLQRKDSAPIPFTLEDNS